MKTLRNACFFLLLTTLVSSCTMWNKVFPPKYGCGNNGGRNVGAEKALDQNPKKVKKFKA
jgi:hypothetical protein